jgi:hypothetical protein
MSKKASFLSAANMADMTKRVYTAHQNEGGSRFLSYFQEQVAGLMQRWSKLDYIDSYESLTADTDLELEQINQDFYREHVNQFLPAGGYARVKKLETVDDYLNYDIQRDPPATVNAATFRGGNAIPLNRKWVSSRNYDRDNEGLKGRSLGLKNKTHPGMDELWEHVNQPTKPMDRGDVQYYGQRTDDDSTALMNTSWN